MGELLVKKVPIPEVWELRRREPVRSPLPAGGKELLPEIERLLNQALLIALGASEMVRDAISKARELGLLGPGPLGPPLLLRN